MRIGLIKTAVAASLVALLSACFTGIESTPRIKGDNDGNTATAATAESSFAMPIASERPSQWTAGKQWTVVDNKISIIFTAPSERTDALAGHKLSLADVRTIPTVTGEDGVQLDFVSDDGRRLSYVPGVSAKEFQSRAQLDVPFAVECSAVSTADSLLRGRSLYINTPHWNSADGLTSVRGLRLVSVNIDSVVPGSSVHPLRVVFNCPQMAGAYSVPMTYGSQASATRNFESLFTFTDPRTKYPRIADATWDLIIHSNVAAGMSRDECRLALGTPASIVRGATNEAQVERWTYDDGIFLIFEDGVLTRFRR